MSLEKEILLILKESLKFNQSKSALGKKIKIPKGNLLEWDEVDQKFYTITPNFNITSKLLINIDYNFQTQF